MESQKQTDIEQMEEKAKIELITLSGDDDHKKEALSCFMDELNRMYKDCKDWMKTTAESEAVETRLRKLREDSEILLAKARLKIQTITENPDVRDKFHEGKEIVMETGSRVAHAVSEGTQELLNQAPVKKVVDNVTNAIDSFTSDERVREGISSLKKGTLKAAESAFSGLKKILDETTEEDKQ